VATDIPAGLLFKAAPEPPKTFNVLLYGPMGSGKSTGAATAPGPILWVNAQGDGALRFPRKVAAERGTQILEVEVPNPRPNRPVDVAQVLRNVLAYWKAAHEPRPATIVLDTIGDVRERLAKQYVNPRSKDTRSQWGEVAKVLKEFTLELRDEPVNLVMIAHESVEDADDDRIVRPAIGGALTEGIPNEMDVVGYCGASIDPETRERRYEAVFVETKGRRAKDRSNGLGVHRVLDLSEWLEAYQQALAPDTSDVPWSKDFDPKESARIDAETAAAEAKADPDAPETQTTLEEAGSTA
jgi:hypothetical protein